MAGANKKICPGCAHEVEVGAEYCPQCGTLLADANKKFCAACYRLIDSDAQYCPQCGAHIGAADEQNVQQKGVNEGPNVQENGAEKEAIVGWVTGVVSGDKWGLAHQMILFTTDRFVVAHAGQWNTLVRHNKDRQTWAEWAQPDVRTTQLLDKLVTDTSKNYAAPYSEITQLRVKLPSVSHRGLVTVSAAQGEKYFRILQKAVPIESISSSQRPWRLWPWGYNLNPYPADWEFLKSPPPKLEAKLVIDGPLSYVR